MVQQFDLAFNMTSTADKMMNQSQSFMNKESYLSKDNQFGNFLDNANKTYENSSKNFSQKSVNSENKIEYKLEDNKKVINKQEEKHTSSKKEASNKEVLKKEETLKDDTKNTDFKEDFKENLKNDCKNESDTENISKEVKELSDNFEIQQTEVVEDENFIMFQTQMLKNDSFVQMNIEKNLNQEDFSTLELKTEIEVPAEAIKNGINIETVLDTDINDLSNVDLTSVEKSVKDIVVSKEDTINSLYNSKKTTVENEFVENEVKAEMKNDFMFKNQEVELNINDETPKSEINTEELISVKNIVEPQEVLLSSEVEKIENISEQNITKISEEVVEKPQLTEDKINLQPLNTEVKQDFIEKPAVKELQTNEKVVVKEDKSFDNKHNDMSEINLKVLSEINKITDTEVKTDLNVMPNKENEVVLSKIETLKQEIDSAKFENTINATEIKTENVANKTAKTNVKAEETIDLKEDVSGIEFKNQPKLEEKEEIHADKKETHLKNKVENVKIKVEENVKVTTVQNQSAEKIEKANETLDKAGLTTETLRKFDGKITDIKTSNGDLNNNFGESSQEAIMRDMLTQNLENSISSSSETKQSVDFVNAMNKAKLPQQAQQSQTTENLPEVDVIEQIRTRITGRNGLQKITFGLTPESLGKVSIEIAKGQNGISAQILAENPQAKEILDKNLDGLKQMLQTQGVNVNNVNVKVAETSRSSDSNNNMFQQDNSQFEQGKGGNSSGNSNDSQKEKQQNYEFIHSNSMNMNLPEENEEVQVQHSDKTVNIKVGNGNVKYQL